ncbi:MAG: preprotein translocase subunit SecA, partial [Planctomycetota bacterium]
MQKTHDIPVVGPLLRAMFGTRNERFVKRFTSRVDAINALEPEVRALTDAQLRAKTEEFRRRIESGEKPVDLLVEAFAVAREAMDRNVGIRNVFNPEHRERFDADRLPAEARALYDETLAAMDAAPDAEPAGPDLGCDGPVPGWRRLDIPTPVYDAVRELYPESRPPFRARPFDVQLIGAMVLYQGKIAEMKTGEGKTIVAPLACYLAALEGLSCHVVTVNEYLVQRDRDWVYPFFRALGLTVGAIHAQHRQPEPVKRAMYRCDVVYGTTSEFGFDYLRDNMKRAAEQQVQRRRDFAVVDEVDSILIDEARTPLIISGPAHEDQPRYDLADSLARHLVQKHRPWAERDEKVQAVTRRIKGLEGDIRNARDKSKIPALKAEMERLRKELPGLEAERDRHVQYYEVQMDRKSARLTHEGIEEAQNESGLGSFYAGENADLPHLLEQAVRAHTVYERDRDYVVMPLDNPRTGASEPSVVIVDTFTGRLQIGRQWSDGLHQAIEAKEGVPIKEETQTVATVTIQNFYKMYSRLAGMTGTADTEAQEFHDIYNLDVVVIPTNVPVVRSDYNDVVYLTGKDKWASIVDEIKAMHDLGRPVLVGTTSVEKSESLSTRLTETHQIRHEVLNAKQHEREANIIENAGALGAVMIATNMAGRGTDIKLQPVTREALVDHWLRRGLAPRDLTPDASDEELREKVYRKIAPKELGISKADADAAPFDDLELRLLRRWALDHTWLDEKKIEQLGAEALRNELDAQGRFALHRLGWAETTEALGGLHVVGTERHESRRIDNQLRGRAGRQGDRGSSRFFVSLEDDLMKMFAGETTLRILSRLGMKEGDAIEHPMLTKSVERAQRKVEERNFQQRKNLLEYDEVMEHQRQSFYGQRQRALEGRDIKGLIFSYVEDAVVDAVALYLAPGYTAEQVAERAGDLLRTSIPADRLRGLDVEDTAKRVREIARDEARLMISVSLGEHLPEIDDPAEEDFAHLVRWARTQFGVELTPAEALGLTRRQIEDRLADAAEARINETDLSPLADLLDPQLGAKRLVAWAKDKFGKDIPLDAVLKAEEPEDAVDLLMDAARQAYTAREIEHPVDFALEMTLATMRQNPQAAAAQFVAWANRRYDLGWDESVVRTKMPQQLREELLAASRRAVESGAIDRAIADAVALADDLDALAAHMKEKFGVEALPPRVLEARPDERPGAVQAFAEAVLRGEMVQLERTILLEVLDPAWKDHLYAMDQLRDSIGFRSFSQLDPRIEYKREGARLFAEFNRQVRERVTDYLFKLRLAPRVAPQPAPRPQPPAPAPQAQPQPATAPRPAPSAA